MNTSQERAKSIFLSAIEISADDERAAYLDQQCGEDAALRHSVEELLAHQQQLAGFLEHPLQGATADFPSACEQPGTYIGPYRLLDKLGEGGMGVVFRAEQQEPVERQVALKIIRPGMDTQRVIARFDAERQALALMDHPNIAKVLDAGITQAGGERPEAAASTTDSTPSSSSLRPPASGLRPYFVMELVQGIAITKYCDQHELSIRERLELFIPVCQAAQHAHQKGIIHRDIKPSNILVAEFDGRPVPKVIDFGVAKAIDQSAVQKQLSTQYGQIVGTLEYMSPEQARLSPHDVDTRSDVYSLGAVLYELLTGITPFDKEKLYSAAFDQALHIIEAEEPPKPSLRLSSSDSLPSVAALRHIEPQRLTGLIRGELDWIVMKALEKDRARRYDSAASLAQDIDHYLHDQPVLAGPPSAAYRLRKFARRNQGLLTTLGLLALVMLVGTAVSVYQAIRATHAEQLAETRLGEVAQQRDAAEKAQAEAESAQKKSETVTQYLVDAFRSPDPERDGRTITVAEVLDRTVAELQDRFTDQPPVKAQLLNALGETYLGLGLYGEAVKAHQESLEILQRVLGPEHPDTFKSMSNLAVAYLRAGRTTEAIALLDEAIPLLRAKLGPEHRGTLASTDTLAEAYLAAGRTDEAIQLQQETLRLRREHLGPEHPDTFKSMGNLANAYGAAGRTTEAIALLDEAIPLLRAKLGPEHPDTLTSMSNLAVAYSAVGRTAEAIQLKEETLRLVREHLGPEHPNTLTAMGNLAVSYWAADRTAKAIQLMEETLPLQRKHLGPEHPDTLTSLGNLAVVYGRTGRLEEAIQLHEEALRLQREHLGPAHPHTLRAMGNLAQAYVTAGRTEEALQLQQETLQLTREHLGPEHPDTLTSMGNLANAYMSAGRTAEAIALREETLRLARNKLGPEHPNTLQVMHNLAVDYGTNDRIAEAIQLLDETLRLRREHLGPEHRDTLMSLRDLAETYRQAGRTTDAIALHEEVLRLRREHQGPEHPDTLALMRALARDYNSVGRYQDATQLFESLLALQRQTQPDSPAVAATLAHLARTLLDQDQFAAAEPYASESWQIRQQKMSDDWQTYDTQSLLGRSLAGQQKFAEAEPLLRSGCQGMKEREQRIPAIEKLRIADALAGLAQLYTDWGQPAAAEPYAREALTMWEQRLRGDWHTFHTQSLLGRSLAGQQKFAEAEPLLRSGYQGLKQRAAQIPANRAARIAAALDSLIQLYTDWGQPEEAEKWRQEREAPAPAPPPTSPQPAEPPPANPRG